MWYERKKKFLDGVKLISEKLSNVQFEEALKKYYDISDDEEFKQIQIEDLTNEQNLLISKTLFYVIQRLRIFLLSPIKLQSDLTELGFTSEQSECVVRLYSESSRHITNSLRTEKLSENDTSITWEVKTTLDESNLRSKKPVARFCIKADHQEVVLEDLNHSDLSNIFDKFETIQKELDVLSAKRSS